MKHLLILMLVAVVGVTASTAQEDSYTDNDVVAVYAFRCDFRTIDDMLAQYKEINLVLLQEQVDAGVIKRAGMTIHHYGDEWNVQRRFRASSLEQIEVARKARIEKMTELYPDLVVAGECSAHKDNVYFVAAETSSN